MSGRAFQRTSAASPIASESMTPMDDVHDEMRVGDRPTAFNIGDDYPVAFNERSRALFYQDAYIGGSPFVGGDADADWRFGSISPRRRS